MEIISSNKQKAQMAQHARAAGSLSNPMLKPWLNDILDCVALISYGRSSAVPEKKKSTRLATTKERVLGRALLANNQKDGRFNAMPCHVVPE
jgi:hypothetical protein